MDSSQSKDIQQAKEEARRLALQLGLVLERRGRRIDTVSLDGDRAVLVDQQSDGTIWHTAAEALKTRVDSNKTKPAPAKVSVVCDKVVAYTDGGSRGNPGPSASGFVLYDATDNAILEEGGEYLGVTTNNQAEYHAVRLALEHSLAYGAKELSLYMDSLLIVNQLNGSYRVKNRDLLPIHDAIKRLIKRFDHFTVQHVPRERNVAADSMVNKILDQHASSETLPSTDL